MADFNKNKINTNILKVGSSNFNLENWEVYSPNGIHMFTCGEKKAKWYLDRNLAKRTDDGKIMLKFKPKGNGFNSNEIFGKSIREPICVVSGIETNLQRHHIVPYCYRTYFPKKYKSKNHHDVVLINYEKHTEYETQATIYKDVIAKLYRVKTINELNLEYTRKLREIGKDNGILLNTIHSIFKTHNLMSTEIKLKKLKIISELTGISLDIVSNYNYIQLYKLFILIRKQHDEKFYKFKDNNRKLYDHGYHVVQKLDTEEKIKEFVKLWRTHFIETMQPKFMPIGWSVDFRIKTNI
jgi:hypothetical protein